MRQLCSILRYAYDPFVFLVTPICKGCWIRLQSLLPFTPNGIEHKHEVFTEHATIANSTHANAKIVCHTEVPNRIDLANVVIDVLMTRHILNPAK